MEETKPKLSEAKRNSLLETSPTARWFNDVLMAKMDQYAFARSFILFTLLAFTIGNNLGLYLWLYVIVKVYILVYRLVRFWVKRQILYLFEFCYFGNFILIAFILFFNQSENVFKITYICNTGVMTFAVITLNNQAQFSSTDHLTSSYIHIMPLITCWAIRWRNEIYSNLNLAKWGFKFYELSNPKLALDDNLTSLITLPIIFWACWAVFYFINSNILFGKYFDNPKFENAINDFIKASPKFYKLLCGDVNKGKNWKYLIQHFFFLIIPMPFAIACYYNFYINTIYVLLFVCFLSWNTGRNNLKHMSRKIMKSEIGQIVEKNLDAKEKGKTQ
jgi:hypothetical protein